MLLFLKNFLKLKKERLEWRKKGLNGDKIFSTIKNHKVKLDKINYNLLKNFDINGYRNRLEQLDNKLNGLKFQTI